MKRLRRGGTTLEIDAGGVPRDATGHRTDRPAIYREGQRLWREDERRFGLGERVRAIKIWHRMEHGECGTIMVIEEGSQRDYYVLPDSLLRQFLRKRSGEFLSRMPEHYLEPE
jgi:hypothetical protein